MRMAGSTTEPERSSEILTPSRLSWSSVSTYAECGQRWLLERGYKVPSSTWFATLAGSAIHEITESRDRLELLGLTPAEQAIYSPTFAEEFDKRVSEVRSTGREVKASGREGKNLTESGGPNKKDFDWWMHFGPIFVQRWMDWKAQHGWTVMTMPDGQPGIELGFDIELAGQRVVGFIDRVYQSADTGVTVFDLKTGKVPSGSLQLKTYDLGLKRGYGVEADWGMFWTPGGDDGGKLSTATDLRAWSDERVEDMYGKAMRGIEAGIFLPQVTNMCKGCPVRDYCWAVAGVKVGELPLAPSIIRRDTGEVSSSPNAQVEPEGDDENEG